MTMSTALFPTKKKMGRPIEDPHGRRSKSLHIRVTEADVARWRAAAEKEGTHLSDAVRSALDAWAEEVLG